MRKFEKLPGEVEGFIENEIRRGSAGVRELSQQIFQKFGVRRGKSWLSNYIKTTVRRHITEDARFERRLRLLKRELGDRPEVLAKVAADVLNDKPKSAARRRRKKAAPR